MWFTSCIVVTFVISNSQRFWCVDQLVGGCRSNMALAVLSALVSARRSQKMLSAPAQVLRAKEVNQTGAWSQNRISISIWHTKSYNLSAISMHMQSHLQLQLFYAILRGGESQKNNLFSIETPTKIPAGLHLLVTTTLSLAASCHFWQCSTILYHSVRSYVWWWQHHLHAQACI